MTRRVFFLLGIFLLIFVMPQDIYAAVNSTAGSFDIDTENPLRFNPISYHRTDIESDDNPGQKDNSVLVTVTYPASFELNCTTHYKLAGTSETYTSLESFNLDSDTKRTSFQFANLSNEVVTLTCHDVSSGVSAFYVISNNDSPLVDFFDTFRDGSIGTEGKLGYLDMITVFVLIFSMIGFNQKNQAAGAIMNVIIIGVTWYFGIIQMPTSILGVMVTITMFVVFASRRNSS